MKKILLTLLLAALLGIYSFPTLDIVSGGFEKSMNEFDDYITMYNKNYKDIKEYKLRYEIFNNNTNKIKNYNQKFDSIKFSKNEYMDLTSEEFKDKFITGYKKKI
jgi:hypothetical protein